MVADCPFCQLAPERIIAQNTHAFAILDAFPVSPGHTLVIPRRHVGSFFDTTQEEKLALLELLEVARAHFPLPLHGRGCPEGAGEGSEPDAISPSPGAARHPLPRSGRGLTEPAPDGWNIGINDAPAAGQTVPHLHIHLIPRYAGDVPDPRGGVRWVMPDKARYWQ